MGGISFVIVCSCVFLSNAAFELAKKAKLKYAVLALCPFVNKYMLGRVVDEKKKGVLSAAFTFVTIYLFLHIALEQGGEKVAAILLLICYVIKEKIDMAIAEKIYEKFAEEDAEKYKKKDKRSLGLLRPVILYRLSKKEEKEEKALEAVEEKTNYVNAICSIEVSEDMEYSERVNNSMLYDAVISTVEDEKKFLDKVYSVKARFADKEISIALILCYFAVPEKNILLDGDKLVVVNLSNVFIVDLRSGSVITDVELNPRYIYEKIIKIKYGYLVIGNREIIMLNYNLNVMWRFAGRSFFETDRYVVCEDLIKIIDKDNICYVLDYSGNLLEEE